MTTFEQALKEHYNIRLSHGSRWLVWDDTVSEWVVYDRPYGTKKNRVPYRGPDKAQAIAALCGE